MSDSRTRSAGFSLAELLIVIAVIGLLAAIALPKFDSADVSGKAAKCKAALQAIEVAEESYSMDTGGWATSVEPLVTNGYLKQRPTCEWRGGTYTYQIPNSAGTTFTFADGTHTTAADYPAGTAFCPIHGTLREFRDGGTVPSGSEPPAGEDPPPGS